MAWDLNLVIEWREKVLVPFHYLVKPHPQLARTPPTQPFQFLRLPIDIQLIAYEHCDITTLFQLMRTCSRTRGPATKLFWANSLEPYWYHSNEDSLFAQSITNHPIIGHCSEFAHRITRIELDLGRLEYFFADRSPTVWFTNQTRSAVKAQYFWEKVERAFPAVKKVVLTGHQPRRPLPPPPGESDTAYTAIEVAVERAPPSMQVQVALEDGIQKSPRYTLWQVIRDRAPTWQVVDADWTPTRVLLPPRIFSASPLGDLLTFTRRNSALSLEQRGIDWLKIESYARYALDGVIRCPCLDCDATFTERSEWDQHLFENHSHSHFGARYGYPEQDHMVKLWCFKGTPQAEQDAIEARQRRIDAKYETVRRLKRRVKYGWGEKGSEQRQLFEEQYYAQLREENFAEPGELRINAEDPLSCEWVRCLHTYFDPTYIHY
jgi:hypothetical protein